MLSQLKRSLVESYMGAIALGWLLADIVLDFVNIFAGPVASWVSRSEFHGLDGRADVPTGFLFRDALPGAVKCLLLLVIWYVLVRWLYMSPLAGENPQQTAEPTTSVGSR